MTSDLHRRVVKLLPDALIFADRGGVIRIWNARAEALFGYPAEEAIGKSLDLIIPEHLRAAHWRGYEAAIASGRTRLGGKAMLTRAQLRRFCSGAVFDGADHDRHFVTRLTVVTVIGHHPVADFGRTVGSATPTESARR